MFTCKVSRRYDPISAVEEIADFCIRLYTKIRSLMLSQCKNRREGVIWEDLGALMTARAKIILVELKTVLLIFR